MAIATELGFVVGGKYKVLARHDPDAKYGEILTFTHDDESHCPYFKNQFGDEFIMNLHEMSSEAITEGDDSVMDKASVENLIQKRNEAKEALIQAQKVLDEKLTSLGLQEINSTIAPVSKENFEWVEAYWTEFDKGDEIKVTGDVPEGALIGVVKTKEHPYYDGEFPLCVNSSTSGHIDWPEQSKSTFYKKVAK